MEDRQAAALRRLQVLSPGFLPDVGLSGGSLRQAPCSSSPSKQEDSSDLVSVPPHLFRDAPVSSRSQYESLYSQSLGDPDGFWGGEAKCLFWKNPWDADRPVCAYNFDKRKGPIFVEWFRGGYTNVCFNAIDRHVDSGRGNQVAVLWEGNDPRFNARITYSELLRYVCQVANLLRSRGVKKGDRVCIYMPMILELPVAMLACARIGAIHSVVFAGFSAEALSGRILDCQSQVVLTCSAVRRGDKMLLLKEIVDEALQLCSQRSGFSVETCVVYDNETAVPRKNVAWQARDIWWQDAVRECSTSAEVEWMESEEPLFMLYTSGSTGKPKGVLHTVGGYMVYASTTFKYCFAPRKEDVFWCTADCGWITGHTYVVYGPLLNGTTSLVYEGVPAWPHPGRCWEIVDKYKVTAFYTAPTLIRSLQAYDKEHVKKFSRSTLRLLATAGEPINPKAWNWYFDVVGDRRCPILDTWWQTETGGVMLTPLPGAWPLKPGSATLPFFGVEPVVLDQQGKELKGPCEGYLCIRRPWPGIARTIYGDHKRYEETYFSTWLSYYNTGDGCRRDENGYITITGRVDDVINVSGHRISTSEVEAALASHPGCAEVAVVGFPHEVKGEGIYAYIIQMDGHTDRGELIKALKVLARKEIGGFAVPDVLHFVPGLPKTRSGKVMRNILRKIASNRTDLGDTSTLADPAVVSKIISSKM
ncbi:hypothetical protein SELMODRAFT_441669 [Selaginella moellendorffii]|uniref:Acetyl-coenzyme A synthetase n=1 Tax=Selaginella moellendorffii TaxID=88036 RepID=D8RLV0_SELML|nr:acetyl-coenzyme A synthetase, chloroplastic/glyoxysomal [Selaginella moellendorffii]EFJ26782.1 hypothetical protein SELMODRAFT_441669 [Selaginella moellendorffii]|eukprot:XP_002971865.1 acetyl-coenzyme A synthetase, chloroplastic/glyoxysomal [Selaginella moellendorffii]